MIITRRVLIVARSSVIVVSLMLLIIASIIGLAIGVYEIQCLHAQAVVKEYASLEQEIRAKLPRYSSYEDVTTYLRQRGLDVRWSEKDRAIHASRRLEACLCVYRYLVTISVDEHQRLLETRFGKALFCL